MDHLNWKKSVGVCTSVEVQLTSGIDRYSTRHDCGRAAFQVATIRLLWIESGRFVINLHNLTSDTRRRSELRRIRHIFIPDLVVRLHQLLFQTRSLFPSYVSWPDKSDDSNLQRALDLTKLVADERLHIYEEFMGSRTQPVRLMRYLDLVRVAATALL